MPCFQTLVTPAISLSHVSLSVRRRMRLMWSESSSNLFQGGRDALLMEVGDWCQSIDTTGIRVPKITDDSREIFGIERREAERKKPITGCAAWRNVSTEGFVWWLSSLAISRRCHRADLEVSRRPSVIRESQWHEHMTSLCTKTWWHHTVWSGHWSESYSDWENSFETVMFYFM